MDVSRLFPGQMRSFRVFAACCHKCRRASEEDFDSRNSDEARVRLKQNGWTDLKEDPSDRKKSCYERTGCWVCPECSQKESGQPNKKVMTMKYFEPTTPFSEAELPARARKAYDRVKTLDENQLRWALWATLVTCFGDPMSNAPAILSTLRPNQEWPVMWEAQRLLMELGMNDCFPQLVEKFVQAMDNTKVSNERC